MKKEINELSMVDALDIYIGFGIKDTDIKVGVRDYLKKNKISVTEALEKLQKMKSSQPKHKAF